MALNRRLFLSTLSLRRATQMELNRTASRITFLSTLSLRRATLRVLDGSKSSIISIHALLAESDLKPPVKTHRQKHFYPRSPCGERRKITITVDDGTLISIHALLAESDFRLLKGSSCLPIISIHALLAESDEPIGTLRTVSVNFYPRSPCGERPNAVDQILPGHISIHALLAESDLRLMFWPFRPC